MKTHPIQTTFAGGEISPRLQSRTDAEFYAVSVAKCVNFVVTPQGSVYKRDGSEYIIDADVRNTVTKIETFRRAVGEDVIVEFGDGFLRLLNRDGPVTDIDNVIRNADFRDGDAFWDVTVKQKGAPEVPIGDDPLLAWVPGSGTLEFAIWNQPAIILPQRTTQYKQQITLQNPADDSIFETTYYIDVDLDDGRGHTYNYFLKVGLTPGGDGFGSFVFPITIPPNSQGERLEFNISHTFNTAGIANVWIFFGVDIEGDGPPPLDENYVAVGYATGLKVVNAGVGDPVEFPSPWTTSQIPDVQTAMATGSDLMIMCHENVEPYSLFVHPLTGDFVFDIAEIVQPGQPYWAGENWPACPAFFQGRLWFGRSANDQSTVWGSAIGNYEDFDPAGAENADDPVVFPLATSGRIAWLSGSKDLIVMTDMGPYAGTSDRGIITSDDFNFSLQFSFGGAAIQPTESGRDTVFISRDQSKIRSMHDGGDETNSDVSMDISLMVENLFRGRADAIEYCQDPNLQLNALVDGHIVSAVFSSQESLLGWYQQILADGMTILDITRTFDYSGTSLWVVIHHDSGIRTIEVINSTESLDYTLDSFNLYSVDVTRIITGLERFEGKFVSIVGASLSGQALIWEEQVIGGEITLPVGVPGQVAIGLRYDAEIVLHKMEYGSNTGSAQPARQRYAYIMARLVDSYPPVIKGQRAERFDYVPPQVPGLESDFITDDVFVDALGWDGTDSKIVISQDIPLKTHITGIFGILATNAK